MPCIPEKHFPGAWLAESPLPARHAPTANSPTKPSLAVMDRPQSDPLQEPHSPSSPSYSGGGSATQLAKKPPRLRIVVPPTEYCPFSTDLTLPITPLSLPTPVSSSCFTFTDMQEIASQSVSVPPTPGVAVADFASPTSSQFLLMPHTPHFGDVDSETSVGVLPLSASAVANEPMRSGSNGIKSGNLRPWEPSSSTWLSDLGGRTETDRIFRHSLLESTSVDADSSPASTPALSPSVVSPSSQVSSILAYNLPTSLSRSLPPLPPALSPHSYTMSPQSPSLARLALQPTGTDTFPSTLDSLQAWRESVAHGIPRSEESRSPPSEDVYGSQLGELAPETVIYPSLSPRQLPSHHLPSRVPRVSRSKTFIKHAKNFGGRVRQLVTRQSVNKHRSSMDRGVNSRVVTSQNSENGSVILITAPPPPYDVRPPTLIRHSPTGQDDVRSRTISEYSSAVQASMDELAIPGMTESSSRQGGSNRTALRRFSLAALSTMKRF